MSSADIRYSKDGRRWSNWKTRSLGDLGDHIAKITARRCGKAEQWVFDVRVTDPVRADMLAAAVQIESER